MKIEWSIEASVVAQKGTLQGSEPGLDLSRKIPSLKAREFWSRGKPSHGRKLKEGEMWILIHRRKGIS